MARTIPYRDLNGYIIESKYKPIFDESRDKLSGGYSVAVLTYCPEIDGLKHIGECEKCEFFRGHKKYEGVMCASEAPDKTPQYMKQTKKPKKNLLIWKQQKQDSKLSRSNWKQK